MLTIKHATEVDIPLIRSLCLQIWPQTYQALLTQEQIDFMLELMYSEAAIKKQLAEEKCQYLLIYEDGLPSGYASFSNLETSIWKLHRLYILPQEQGKGIGKNAINYIIDIIKKENGKILKLQVHRKNKAKLFYENLGFSIIETADFDIGNGYFMTDYVMEKEL